jgi:hypothetical protein
MANIIGKAAAACAVAGVLAVAAAAPALAQIYGGPQVYVGPYGGYAYAPGYRGGYGYWEPPNGYDSSGMAFSYRELGWQPGYPGAAPANPCNYGQRIQNRC